MLRRPGGDGRRVWDLMGVVVLRIATPLDTRIGVGRGRCGRRGLVPDRGHALFLGIVAVAPALLGHSGDINSQPIQAASLLIVVGVVLDTVKQLEAQMVMRNYSGFLS